jgi:hypothetical protein
VNQYPAVPATLATSGAGPKLFISYRRDDSASAAGRIYDRLAAYFGRDAIFKDVDNIPVGQNFEQIIVNALQQSAVTLVLIGPQWATVANDRGRRLDDPQDPVRIEVETALRRGGPVIPLFVEGAAAPNVATLPPSIRPLFAQNALQARNDPWFDGDMSQLATTLSQWLPLRVAPATPDVAIGPTPRRRVGRTVGVASLTLAASVVLIVALILIGLAGAGLAGQGPFGALGGATPYATTPIQPTATPLPVEHVKIDENLTRTQSGWEKDSTCVFKSDGYHVIATPFPPNLTASENAVACIEEGTTYTNFHLTAHVHVPGGATQAQYFLAFRINDKIRPTNLDDFSIDVRSNQKSESWNAVSRSNDEDNLYTGFSTSIPINTGDNTLEVYANGSDFTIFVNGVALGSFRDPINDHAGYIGLGVIQGEAIYTSVKIATLG